MKLRILILLLSLSLSPTATATKSTQDVLNFLGSAVVGAGSGGLVAAVLLLKDHFCGILIKGGKEYHGRERIKPLVQVTLGLSLVGGVAGYVLEQNFLSNFSRLWHLKMSNVGTPKSLSDL